MGKSYAKCGLCEEKRYLNFSGLCKRCRRTKEGCLIVKEALGYKHEQEELESAREDAVQEVKEEQVSEEESNVDEE